MEIILIRHGKPESANNPVINAAEFTRWVKRYNTSNVALNSRPTSINNKISKYFVISSDLKRAIHSAKIYTHDAPKETYKLFR